MSRILRISIWSRMGCNFEFDGVVKMPVENKMLVFELSKERILAKTLYPVRRYIRRILDFTVHMILILPIVDYQGWKPFCIIG